MAHAGCGGGPWAACLHKGRSKTAVAHAVCWWSNELVHGTERRNCCFRYTFTLQQNALDVTKEQISLRQAHLAFLLQAKASGGATC